MGMLINLRGWFSPPPVRPRCPTSSASLGLMHRLERRAIDARVTALACEDDFARGVLRMRADMLSYAAEWLFVRKYDAGEAAYLLRAARQLRRDLVTMGEYVE